MEPPAKKARSAAPGVGGGGSGKAAPVLPWMRVPITIDPGSGTPVDQVHGLDDRLRAALLAGKDTWRRGKDTQGPSVPLAPHRMGTLFTCFVKGTALACTGISFARQQVHAGSFHARRCTVPDVQKPPAPTASACPTVRAPSHNLSTGRTGTLTPDPPSRTEQLTPPSQRCALLCPAGFRYRELFPVQAVVWEHSGGGLSTAHDLCVAAPTGSGKTLAYALPVVNALAA